MPLNTSTLTSSIGARIRRERIAREWTLDQLSDAADISRRQLVNVEQGETNPSIGTLLAISDALGISLPALVEQPSDRMVVVHRAGEGAELWAGENGGRGVLLVGTRAPDVVEIWDWRMNSGERHDSAAHHRGSRELLHVLSGIVTLDVAEDRFELQVGDSISFPGDVAHAYSNESAHPVSFSLAVFDPHDGSVPLRKDPHV